jgi:hypothetical protein
MLFFPSSSRFFADLHMPTKRTVFNTHLLFAVQLFTVLHPFLKLPPCFFISSYPASTTFTWLFLIFASFLFSPLIRTASCPPFFLLGLPLECSPICLRLLLLFNLL